MKIAAARTGHAGHSNEAPLSRHHGVNPCDGTKDRNWAARLHDSLAWDGGAVEAQDMECTLPNPFTRGYHL